MQLSDLKTGEKGIIVKVGGSGAFRKRILEMGFVRGKQIKAILNAPLKDPIKYKIMDYEVSLRRSEAHLIEIIPDTEDVKDLDGVKSDFQIEDDGSLRLPYRKNGYKGDKKIITVALVGNPNAGKTSLFNKSSGAHEHVGNYGGVTVDSKEGRLKHKGYVIRIIDLPGTYSLSAYTPEELFVRQHLVYEEPDVVINVVAASNLERNLYLTTELIDMEAPVVIALNMYDELVNSGNEFNYEKLSRMIGIPMIPTVAKTGSGLTELFDKVVDMYEGEEPVARTVRIYYGNMLENAISKLNILMDKDKQVQLALPNRYLSIKLLEKDSDVEKYVKGVFANGAEIVKLRDEQAQYIEESLKEDTESLLTNAKYGFVAGGLKETYKDNAKDSDVTGLIDAFVTNKYLGFPIFFFLMWLMFECTFTLGSYPQGWIESGVDWFATFVRNLMSDGMLKDLLVDGIISGVGEVIVFLPNILILYAFISFMEDSGYMARAAFIMDKVMHKMGLHGKSFIPLIMGFGCTVPAIMATRTIESRNSRMITMLINPFMSCSARLPVYLLFSAIFFDSYASYVLFGLYLTGILLAVLSARIFKRFLFSHDDVPFVMELPPYRTPTARGVVIHMWDKSKQYLKHMGVLILIASIIIWFLSYFPQNPILASELESQIGLIQNEYTSNDISETEKDEKIEEIEFHYKKKHQENSFIGEVGRFIEPVMRPLGFDWKISVALLSGLAAKEVVVSTLAVLYTGNSDEEGFSLKQEIKGDKQADGSSTFTPLVVISLLLFVLIYFPCVATVVAIKEESGSWKWGVFSVLYTTSLAWVVSFAIYQIGSLL